MNKKTLLLVDTDTGFHKRFQLKLEIDDIADKYQVLTLEPDTTLAARDMAEKVVAEARAISSKEDVCAILVDIVIYERAPFDTDGILVVEELRKAFPQTPIFNVSGKANDPRDMDHFAEATLGSSDGVFFKSFLEGDGFSAKRLKFLLKRGNEKRYNSASPPSVRSGAQQRSAVQLPPDIERSFNIRDMDPRVAAQIAEIGAGAFWGLMLRLIPGAEGVFSYIAPGASGAYVFEAKLKFKEPGTSSTGAKPFLIKVGTTPDALSEEARNRRDLVKAPVGRKCFPTLLREEPAFFEGLSAIAYEFESEHETLLAHLARSIRNGERTTGLGQDLVDILKGIYGDPVVTVRDVAKGCYQLEHEARIRLLGYLKDNASELNEVVSNDKFRRVVDFLERGTDALPPSSKEIDTRHIHGDFNCGNILLNADSSPKLAISIIDLGSRRQDHIIKDVAKLERDIVFRVFDWGSIKYHDPSRLSDWRPFLATLTLGDGFYSSARDACEDRGMIAAIELIYELRSAIKAIDLKWDERNYLIALLHYSLLAILHPRVSIAKKAFAVEYASVAIDQLKA